MNKAAPPLSQPEFDGFTILETAGSGGMGVVYVAKEDATGRTLALKTVQGLDGKSIYRIKQEFRSLRDLQHRNLVRLDELFFDGQHWFFTMELIGGEDFVRHVRGEGAAGGSKAATDTLGASETVAASATMGDVTDVGPSDTGSTRSSSLPPLDEDGSTRLRTALIQLLEGLAFLHQHGRVHCDIKPANVMVDGDGRVVILDFGLIRDAEDEDRRKMEGTPAFMAPEQATGGAVTAAADIYAVGVLLYEVLWGRRPFAGSTSQVLADKQRREVDPPTTAGIDEDLAALCLQMLKRKAEERPSVTDALSTLGHDVTTSGEHHVTDDLFVGRVSELITIGDAIRSSQDGLRAVVVRGEAGVGKSALLQEALRQYTDESSLVLSSRCHEREAVPLNALDGIADGLSRHLLSIDAVDAALLLPTDTTALVQVFPVLERVPTVAKVARHRGGVSAEELLSVAASHLSAILVALSADRSLVLVIDDVQWADEASKRFLHQLFADNEPQALPLALLATSRPVDADFDPLTVLFREAPSSSLGQVVDIEGLSATDSASLIAGWDVPLDEAVIGKVILEAEGHPFLLRELARFASSTGGQRGLSLSNLFDALDRRVQVLSEIDQRIIEAVACAGTPVDLRCLALALDLPLESVSDRLLSLQRELLVRVEAVDDGRLSAPYHDRIRETVEQRLDKDAYRRDSLHASLGAALLEVWGTDGPQLFAAVGNLNRARGLESFEMEPFALAKLNLVAAERAKASGAFHAALDYGDVGLSLCLEHPEDDRFAPVRFELLLLDMESASLGGDEERARRQFPKLRRVATTPKQIGRAYGLWSRIQTNRAAYQEGLDTALEGARALGLPLAGRAGVASMFLERARLSFDLRGTGPADLVDLPPCADDRLEAATRLGLRASEAAYFVDGPLMVSLATRGVRRLLQAGATSLLPQCAAGEGLLTVGLSQDFERAAAFAESALTVDERGNGEGRANVYRIVGAFVAPWVWSPARQLELLDIADQVGHDTGDFRSSWVAQLFKTLSLRLYGRPRDALACARSASALSEQRNLVERPRGGLDYWMLLPRLLDGTMQMPSMGVLESANAAHDENTFVAYHVLLSRLSVLCHFTEEGALAVSVAEKLAPVAKKWAFADAFNIERYLYGGIAGARLSRTSQGATSRRARALLRKSTRWFKDLNEVNPTCFRGFWLLTEALTTSITGSAVAVEQDFASTISTFEDAGFGFPHAMSMELYAEWSGHAGHPDVERRWDEAIAAYDAIECAGKVAYLNDKLGRSA